MSFNLASNEFASDAFRIFRFKVRLNNRGNHESHTQGLSVKTDALQLHC